MGYVSAIYNIKTKTQTNKSVDSCRITFGMNASLQMVLPQNVCLMLFSPLKKWAVDVEKNNEGLFDVYPQLEVLLSLRCQVSFL